MIELIDLYKTFRSEDVETAALSAIDVVVNAGEFVAIMGPSGCGKSTLLNVLGTIDYPTSGRYLFNGRDITRITEAERTRIRRDNLGFVFQNFNLIDELTISENIELALAYRDGSPKAQKAKAETAMSRVGISHRAKHFPHQLSGGQQQRAAIARAIVGDPTLILADEPTGNLDTENGSQVMEILRSLNEAGTTIVMVTHSRSHADVAKRRIDMVDGRIVTSAEHKI